VTGSAATSAQDRAHEGYIVTPDSLRLFYRVTGAGPDTLIAIHGGPGVDLESIAADFAPLEARHTIIFYDQRGAGRSTLPGDTARLGARQQVEDLETVRRHFGIARMTLIAHSYGPLLAATYALAHPDKVKRMVFFGPVPPRRGDFFSRMGLTFNARLDSAARSRLADAGKRLVDPRSDTAEVRRACREYWSIALRPRLADPDRTLTLLRSDLCASNADGIRFGLNVTNRMVMASYGDWDLRAPLAKLDVPTLIVHGEAEAIPMDLIEEWVHSMPRAQLLRVPGTAHYTYAERPEIVWPAVERFLSGDESVKQDA
jgi:proline iminopeptidase